MTVRPLVTIVVGVVVVEAVLLLTDTGPNIWLVAALVGLVGATFWFVRTIDRIAERATPAPPPPAGTATFPDLRTSTLRQALASGRADARHARRLREQLVAIVDDELLMEHGIDRHVDPEAARAMLGDELTRFVGNPDQDAPFDARALTGIVTRIEQLGVRRP